MLRMQNHDDDPMLLMPILCAAAFNHAHLCNATTTAAAEAANAATDETKKHATNITMHNY